jgi:hypothetical protein
MKNQAVAKWLHRALAAVLLGAAPGMPAAGDPSVRAPSVWPPTGRPEKVAVNRDVWLSSIDTESRGNNGGASRWKLKGIQEFSLFDADLSSLKGRCITGALLHMRSASPDSPARRVSISTVATPWIEGTGEKYDQQPGSACFLSPALGVREWAYPGSTLLDAAWGKGHTIWRFAEATSPDAQGWQSVAIEPAVVAANMAGLSHGFAAMDDVGSEWSIRNGIFEEQHYCNRYFYSRHQHASEPWLEVWTSGEDRQVPEAVAGITVETAGLPPGVALLKWRTPIDPGQGRVLGFLVTLMNEGAIIPVPRYLIPMAGAPGEEVRMLLQDMHLKPGQTVKIGILAVDFAGNAGPERTFPVTVAKQPEILVPDPSQISAFAPVAALPAVGGARVAVVDLLDKIEARTGRMIPPQPPGYKGGNHLWSAAARQVRLQAARNESVAFQVNLEGRPRAVSLSLTFPEGAVLQTSLHRFDYVNAADGVMPDGLRPLTGAVTIPSPDDPQAAGQNNASFLVEIYVPHVTPPGPQRGTLSITVDGQRLDLAVELMVWNFTLPNQLSFVPEMNCYGTGTPTGPGLAYYRLAHAHRTCLNRLYYGWNCIVRDGAAPEPAAGGGFDWTRYDREFGPLFDGSAFADLPRSREPVDVFYLPFNENWPVPIRPHYKPNYWADEAFDSAYARDYRAAAAAFARHISEKKWHTTAFEFYLNNKVFFRGRTKNRDILAPWILDEPANIQDFWALRWYGILFHQGADPVRGDARMWFRADVSRSAFSRNMLWGVLDMEVMGGANRQTLRMKRDEGHLWSPAHVMEYGTANDPRDANTQPVIWSLRAWSNGSQGVLPWQTIGESGAWETAEATCLFYPSAAGPLPSVRLKAFTRGQQDIEYLELLANLTGHPRAAIAAGLGQLVDLSGRLVKTGSEDAGTWRADQAAPQALWEMRTRVAAMLDARKPTYRRVVRHLPTPKTDMTRLPDIGYVTVAPPVPSTGPSLPQGL